MHQSFGLYKVMFVMSESTSWMAELYMLLDVSGLSAAAWLSLSLCLSVCAMLSKEQGITVTAICLVYDFFIAQQVSL